MGDKYIKKKEGFSCTLHAYWPLSMPLPNIIKTKTTTTKKKTKKKNNFKPLRGYEVHKNLALKFVKGR